MRSLIVESMGLISYGAMLEIQNARHARVAADQAADTLYLLEHNPVITAGRNAHPENLLAAPAWLNEHGIEYFATNRGGDVTFHGEGQLVGYPIIKLTEPERDVRRYVTCLEEILIATLADFGLVGMRRDGLRGVFVAEDKIGAVGVRIAQWTTLHGFALNVTTDLDYFKYIIPCGLAAHGVTSMQKLLGRALAMAEVCESVIGHAARILNRQGARREGK